MVRQSGFLYITTVIAGTQSSYSLAYLRSVYLTVAMPVWLFRSANKLEKNRQSYPSDVMKFSKFANVTDGKLEHAFRYLSQLYPI